MLLFFSYESKWNRAALLLVSGETYILVGEGTIQKSETGALERTGCLYLQSEDNETYLGVWLCKLSALMRVRLLAHNRYSASRSQFENAQDWFPSPTIVFSSGIHSGCGRKEGSTIQRIACMVAPHPWEMNLQTRGRGLCGSWTGFIAVRIESSLYPQHPPSAGPGRQATRSSAEMQALGFPGGTSSTEPTCQYRRHKGHGFDPWVRKIPWTRTWQPMPVFLPGESHVQRSLAGYNPQDRRVGHD